MVLFHCHIVNNQNQHSQKILCKFVPNRPFDQQLTILSKNHSCWQAFHSEFSYIEVRFTNKNSVLLEIKDRIVLT